jgi:two-component system KDP operon response regulator KdpE
MTEDTRKTCALVVEDDPNIVDLIRSNLAVRGFDTIVSVDGMRALQLLETEDPDIVLLDLMLPEADGFELCRQIRERSPVAIIVVSARGGERDKVTALHMGADDYMTKPFSIEELLARITATLRRTRPAAPTEQAPQVIVVGDIVIDLALQQVRRGGQPVHLTPTEFGQAAHPRPPAPPGVGPRLRDRDRVPARIRAPAARQARSRGERAPDPHPAAGRLPARLRVIRPNTPWIDNQ